MDETDELIIQLCTQIGTMMEDASVVALTIRRLNRPETGEALGRLNAAAKTIRLLSDAVMALNQLG